MLQFDWVFFPILTVCFSSYYIIGLAAQETQIIKLCLNSHMLHYKN